MRKKGKKILLMDDEKSIRDIYKQILTALGYQIYLAKDGVQAIKLLKESIKVGDNFDAAILDLTIPEGMGGKDTIVELKKIDPNIKSIAVSGHPEDPIILEYKKHGFDTVVIKPFKVHDLSKIIDKLIDQ